MTENKKTPWYVWVIAAWFAWFIGAAVLNSVNQPSGLEGFVEESEKFKE
jgi:hypothetical protein